jgi:hypothetical protein
MNAVPTRGDFVSQQSQIVFLLSLGTFGPRPVGLQNPQAYCRDPQDRDDKATH